MLNKYVQTILLSVAMVMPAYADSVFKDGPHLAYPRGGDIRDSQLGFGWQVTYEPSDYWAVDLSISRQTDRLDDLGVLAAPFEDRFDLELIGAAASVRVAYPLGMTSIYAGGGVGYYYLRTDNKHANRSLAGNSHALPAGVQSMRASVNLERTFGYHAAVGIERILTRRWEVFAEYRWVWLDTHMRIRRVESRGGLQQDTFTSRNSFSYDHGLIRTGVNYRF